MVDAKLVSGPSAAEREQSWLTGLEASGFRLTAARRAVVSVLAAADRPLLPSQIYDQARLQHAKLGLVTVYRTLETLEELGFVQQLHQPDGTHAYLAAFDGHQHLLICERCGRIEIFKGEDLSAFSQRLEAESGFKIHDHWLQFLGLCEDCQNKP
jgi:Fe2+ or Zn2+ uptake regulation protein